MIKNRILISLSVLLCSTSLFAQNTVTEKVAESVEAVKETVAEVEKKTDETVKKVADETEKKVEESSAAMSDVVADTAEKTDEVVKSVSENDCLKKAEEAEKKGEAVLGCTEEKIEAPVLGLDVLDSSKVNDKNSADKERSDLMPTEEPKSDAYGKLDAQQDEDVMAPRLDGDIGNIQSSKSMLGNFMDSRLSFSLSDDNWLAGPGQTTPSSPDVDFFPRRGNRLFFDNLNTRNSGFETLSQMVLHRRQKGFIPGMETEAAIVARFTWSADPDTGRSNAAFRDDGTYLRIKYYFNGSLADKKAPNVDVVMFPFNSNRFRLGYLYDISWGGNEIFPSRGIAVPGMKVQFSAYDGYAYVGAKTARLLDRNINEINSYWGGLAGAGYDFMNMLQIDAGGGIFRRGNNLNQGVEDQPVWGGGASARMVFHLGQKVPKSIDFRLYNSDPALANLFQMATKSRKKFRFLAAFEISHLEQTLQDASKLQSTKLQGWGNDDTLVGGATAAALSAQLGYENWSFRGDAIYRDLSFITFSGPGYIPFQDLPKDSVQSPEFFFALQASYFLEQLHLTPGVVLGMQMPASFTGFDPARLPSDTESGIDVSKGQTTVVRNIGSRDILPCQTFGEAADGSQICDKGQAVEPIYAARLSLKWDLSRMFSIVGQGTFSVDNNETDIVDGNTGSSRQRVSNADFIPGFVLPGTTGPHNVRLGGGLFAQVRF